MPEFRQKHTTKNIEDGVRIIRVPVPSVNRSSLTQRLFQLIIYQLGVVFNGISEQYDVILLSNPSFEVGLPYAVLASLRRKPAIYSVHDVYPDVGIKLGIFHNPWVVRFITSTEKFCLDQAVFVRILSETFAPAMRSLGVPEGKIELIYDWVDTELIKPLPRKNSFSYEFGLVDSFVILYAGNIGLSQGLGNVLTAAKSSRISLSSVSCLLVMGQEGIQLENEAVRRGLSNVLFIPFQTRARLPEVLATADISLVVLQKGIGSASLPSKSFSIMSSGRPLLASVDPDSDLSRLVERSQCGICVLPEDFDALTKRLYFFMKIH